MTTISDADALIAANTIQPTTTHLFYHDAAVFKCRWTYWAYTVLFILLFLSVFLSWVGIGGLAALTYFYVNENRKRNGKILLFNQLVAARMASGEFKGQPS